MNSHIKASLNQSSNRFLHFAMVVDQKLFIRVLNGPYQCLSGPPQAWGLLGWLVAAPSSSGRKSKIQINGLQFNFIGFVFFLVSFFEPFSFVPLRALCAVQSKMQEVCRVNLASASGRSIASHSKISAKQICSDFFQFPAYRHVPSHLIPPSLQDSVTSQNGGFQMCRMVGGQPPRLLCHRHQPPVP
jgi:hypothetical protein